MLDSFMDRVRENRDLMSAVEFARFVLNSRLPEVLEAAACDGPLKVDGVLIRWKANELEEMCAERFRLNDSKPHIEALQLQSIREKLDTMAGYLAELAGKRGRGRRRAFKPVVISGGVNGAPVQAAEVGKQCVRGL